MQGHTGRQGKRIAWRPAMLVLALGICAWLIAGTPPANGLAGPPAAGGSGSSLPGTGAAPGAKGPAGSAGPPAPFRPVGRPQAVAALERVDWPRDPARPAAVLYDQYDYLDQTGVSSQQFEPALAAYNAQAADDFVVPAGQTWTVSGVDVAGGYYGGPGPVDSMNVFFYRDVPTTTGGLPGAAVFTATGILPTPGLGPGDLSIALSSPAVLPAGTYWVSVQANLHFYTGGQWYWRDRQHQTLSGAAWRNPGGGFGTSCSGWTTRERCDGNYNSYDQVFRLNGSVNGPPVPSATGTRTTPTPVPAPPTPTGTAILPFPLLTQPPALPTATPQPACGPFWREVAGANAGNGNNYLSSVAALAPDDVWAVGSYSDRSTPEQPLTVHWNGQAWSAVPSPNTAPSISFLTGVAGTATNDVWAVGAYYDGTAGHTLILHWDGQTWSRVPSPNVGPYTNSLQAVTAAGPGDVWAAGYYSTDGSYNGNQALMEHWDGTRWRIVGIPGGGMESWLYGLSARAANDVWAVGFYDTADYRNPPLTEHWDGTRWTVIPADPTVPNAQFYSVAIGPGGDAWAVGSYQNYEFTQQAAVEHWDGAAWTWVSTAFFPYNQTTHLTSVVEVAANDVWADGTWIDGLGITHPLLEHWDGTSWNVAANPDRAPLNSYLGGIASAGPGDLWAAGAFFPGRLRTLVEHYSDPCVAPSPTRPPTATPAGGRTATATPPPALTPTAAPPTDTPTAGPSPTPCEAPFSDVQPYDYFYPQVAYLACRGVISGYADGTFQPYNGTTRSQMVKIVVLGFSLPLVTPPASATFADVPPGSPFFAVIETAAGAALVSGYNCGGPDEPCDPQNRPYFRPYAAVTRGQLAKVVVVAAGWALQSPAAATFADVFPGTAFYPFVETAYCHAALSGYNCGSPGEPCDGNSRPYFRPGNNAVRAQIATLVYGALQGTNGCFRRR